MRWYTYINIYIYNILVHICIVYIYLYKIYIYNIIYIFGFYFLVFSTSSSQRLQLLSALGKLHCGTCRPINMRENSIDFCCVRGRGRRSFGCDWKKRGGRIYSARKIAHVFFFPIFDSQVERANYNAVLTVHMWLCECVCGVGKRFVKSANTGKCCKAITNLPSSCRVLNVSERYSKREKHKDCEMLHG